MTNIAEPLAHRRWSSWKRPLGCGFGNTNLS